MRPILGTNNAELYEQAKAQRDRMASYVRTATPELADRLGKAAVAYNWVDPGIITSMVLSGNDAALGEVSKIVGEKGWKFGASPTDRRPDKYTPQEQAFIAERLRNKYTVPSNKRYTPPKNQQPPQEEEDKGLWDKILGAVTSTPSTVFSIVKGFSQGFTAGGSFIPQLVSAELYNLANYLPSGHSFKTQRDKNLFDQFVAGPLKQTQLGQFLGQSVQAAFSDEKVTWEDLAGTGFFMGGKIYEESTKAAREYRPMVGTGENASAFTFGRSNAQVLADVGVIQEGTVPYNLLSGIVDFFVQLRVDPSLGPGPKAPKSAPFGVQSKALQAVEDADAIKAAAGLANGARRTVVPNLWDKWKNTPVAVNVLQPMVDEQNPAVIWRSGLKRQGILTADELANAGDHQQVIDVLDKAVRNIDPQYNVRNLPSGNFSVVTEQGLKIKESSRRMQRLFAEAPESTFIPRSDPNTAATRLDDLMAYLQFDMGTRNEWINRYIETYKDGSSKAFFEFLNDWEAKVIGDALVKNGVPKSEVSRLTRWRQETIDRSARFTLQDIGNNVSAGWIDAGGVGPFRTTQLFQDGAYVVDPSNMDEIFRKLGSLYKLEQEAKKLGVVGYPGVAAIKTVDVMGDIYGVYQTYIWKPITIAAFRYLSRVLPDEMGRVYLNQTFDHAADYLMAMFDGRFSAKMGANGKYVADVFGDNMNKVILLQDTEQRIAAIQYLKKQISDLRSQGKLKEAADLAAQNKDELNSLGKLTATKERTEAALQEGMPNLNEALIGAIPRKASRRIIGDNRSGAYLRSKASDIASRLVPRERKLWVDGVVQEVADLYNNPHIRRIANGGLFPEDIVTVNGIKAPWGAHLKAGRSLPPDEAISRWLFSGSGRRHLEKYFNNFAHLNPNFNWNSIDGVREFVRVLNNEVQTVAGTNKTILETIANGTFNGKKAFTRTMTNTIEGEDSFVKFVDEVFSNDPAAPTHMRYRPRAFAGEASIGSRAVARYDAVIDFFFRQLYGKSSDFLSRSPSFRSAYWGRIEEIAPLLNRAAAKQLLKNLGKANLPNSQKTRVGRLLNIANGGNDLETADFAAKAFALSYTRNLLFDASKRTYIGEKAWWAFPFFEAYREQGTTWGKILTQRPSAIHKIDLAVRALRESEGVFPYDYDMDGEKDGILYKDPSTGEEMVGIPGSGPIGRMFSNVPFGGFSLPSKSMTLVSSVLPGFGPAVQYPLQYFVPTTKNWEWVNKTLFPFGRPEETGQQPLGGLANLELTRPTWFRRISPYLSDKAKEMPLVGGTLGDVVSDFIKRLGANEEETQIYKAYYANVLKSVSSTMPIPNTQREMETLLAEVEDRTNKLYFLRGLGNFTLPGTPVSKFFAKTKEGSVELGLLADTLREYEKEAEEAGQDRTVGSMRFLEVFGESVWTMFANVRRSEKYQGLVMSKEFEDWFDSNRDLIDTYPSVAGFFGPQDEPAKFGPSERAVYNRFINKGIIRVQSPEEYITEAQTNVAYTLYESVRGQMPLAQQNTAQGKAILRVLRDEIKSKFPKWDLSLTGQVSQSKREDQIRQLREIVNEPKIKDTATAKATASYLKFRDQKIEELFRNTGTRGWQKGARSAQMRFQLEALGTSLSAGIPGFAPLWDRILSREFETTSMEE